MNELDIIPGTEFLFDHEKRFEYRYPVLAGGRGSGKSWSVARSLIVRGCNQPLRVLCVRELQKSIAESVHKLIAEQIKTLGLGDYFEIQNNGIYGRNGTEFIFTGIRNNSAAVKSTEGVDVAWVEEGQTISEESWEDLDPTIRKPGSQVIVVYNPKYNTDHIHKKFALEEPPPGTRYVKLNYTDNPWFPEALRPQMEHMKRTNPLMYRHVWLGEVVPNLTNALWPWEAIDSNRLKPGQQGQVGRTVVSVDPAVTANKRSDETGIVVVAASKGAPRHYYVLSDVSGRYSPEGWAQRAMAAYDEFEADAIVFEVNQGGDLVKEAVANHCRTLGRAVPRLIEVRATKGKVLRAEPVAGLYEQGLVHHVGYFPKLEEQMVQFNPTNDSKDAKSPDRADALVHGLTELSQGRAPMRIAASAVERLVRMGR